GNEVFTEQNVSFNTRRELADALKFSSLAGLVFLALDSVDVAVRTGFDVRGVSFVGVDVHREFEIRIHTHQHVSENQFAISLDSHAHKRFVADAVTKGVLRAHVNMSQRADNSTIDLNAALRTLQ